MDIRFNHVSGSAACSPRLWTVQVSDALHWWTCSLRKLTEKTLWVQGWLSPSPLLITLTHLNHTWRVQGHLSDSRSLARLKVIICQTAPNWFRTLFPLSSPIGYYWLPAWLSNRVSHACAQQTTLSRYVSSLVSEPSQGQILTKSYLMEHPLCMSGELCELQGPTNITCHII